MAEEQEYLEWERVIEARTFGLSFVKEGQIREVHVNRHSLCLVRRGDRLLAFRARCPHAGGPMAGGKIDEDGNVECPWHRIKFCPETGKNPSGEGYHLQTYPVQIRKNGLYIGFKPRKPWWSIF